MSTSTTVALPEGLKAGLWLSSLNNTDKEFEQAIRLNKRALVHEDFTSRMDAPNLNRGIRIYVGELPNTISNAHLLLGDFAETNAKTTLNFGEVHNCIIAHVIAEPGSGNAQWLCIPSLRIPQSVEASLESQSYLKRVPSRFELASGTTPRLDRRAEARFETLFQRNSEEYFEDGVESDFAREIEILANTNRESASMILTRLLEANYLEPNVWAEAMRWLGQTHAISRESRILLLAKGLFSSSPTIRDGAIVGLASLRDSSALPYLKQAYDRESSDELRADMLTLIEWLSR